MSAITTHARARWTEGQQFVASASSGHAQVIDADRTANTGPSPMELVLMGLCGCTATDVVLILGKARQRFQRVEVSASGERAPEPPQVYTKIHVVYRIGGQGLDRAAVVRAVRLSQEKYCSVSLMLARAATITYELQIDPET